MTAPATGHVAVWVCLCSDAGDDFSDLPTTCPGHGSERIGEPVANRLPGGVASGHHCWERRCPPERVPDPRADVAREAMTTPPTHNPTRDERADEESA